MEDSVSGVLGASLTADADHADERWWWRLSGILRGGVVGAAGALPFLTGVVALRGLMSQTSFPPWVVVSAWTASAAVAVVAMAITSRMLTPLGVDREGIDPAARPASSNEPGRVPARAMPQRAATAVTADEEAPAPASFAPVEPTPSLERFQVDTRRGRRIVAASDVEWLEANGNYARLHTAGEALLYRMPLSRLEQQLEPQRFVRVHRSAIVNLDSIRRIEPFPSGDAVLHLDSGASVRMSRRFARRFHRITGRDAGRSASSSPGG